MEQRSLDEWAKKYARDVDLAARYNIHRKTVWRWTREGRLPKPKRLAPGTVRWDIAEIERFDRERETV